MYALTYLCNSNVRMDCTGFGPWCCKGWVAVTKGGRALGHASKGGGTKCGLCPTEHGVGGTKYGCALEHAHNGTPPVVYCGLQFVLQ